MPRCAFLFFCAVEWVSRDFIRERQWISRFVSSVKVPDIGCQEGGRDLILSSSSSLVSFLSLSAIFSLIFASCCSEICRVREVGLRKAFDHQFKASCFNHVLSSS